MKSIPKEHLNRQSVAILADTFREGGKEIDPQRLLSKNPTLFSTVPKELRDTIIPNLNTFIRSDQRFYDLSYLAWKMKTMKPLSIFLVWVISNIILYWYVGGADIETKIILV